MTDHQIDYTFAGKGAKARQRLSMREILKKVSKPKPEYQRNLKPRAEEREPITITARGMKRKIILLTLQLDSFTDIYKRLDQEGYGVGSKVMVASVRNHTLDVLRAALEEGLIDEDTLNKYRKRCAKEQRERFNRRD